MTRPPGSSSAPTTTSPSRSSFQSSYSVSERSTGGAATTGLLYGRSQVCVWTRSAARSTATAGTSRSPGNSSPFSKSSSRPKAVWSAPRNCWSGRGMRTPTRSPTPCASRCRRCVSGLANPGSSPPWPASATASTPHPAPGGREATVDRASGLSVRLKLTLSYAGFLVLAGVVLLALWAVLLRFYPHAVIIEDTRSGIGGAFAPGRSGTQRAFGQAAAVVLAFLLVFGLAGGWLLSGRMLAPLTRITDATRMAANGSLSHRIRLEDRTDEFRELADSFDAMLARLESHVAEQQRFAANASHELRTPLAITQALLDVASNDPNRDNAELDERLRAVNTRAIDLTEALLLLTRADQRSF